MRMPLHPPMTVPPPGPLYRALQPGEVTEPRDGYLEKNQKDVNEEEEEKPDTPSRPKKSIYKNSEDVKFQFKKNQSENDTAGETKPGAVVTTGL